MLLMIIIMICWWCHQWLWWLWSQDVRWLVYIWCCCCVDIGCCERCGAIVRPWWRRDYHLSIIFTVNMLVYYLIFISWLKSSQTNLTREAFTVINLRRVPTRYHFEYKIRAFDRQLTSTTFCNWKQSKNIYIIYIS